MSGGRTLENPGGGRCASERRSNFSVERKKADVKIADGKNDEEGERKRQSRPMQKTENDAEGHVEAIGQFDEGHGGPFTSE
jgi:hypothetical protein